ncbi:hypothetical protein ACNR90_004117 [Candidozyma auris]
MKALYNSIKEAEYDKKFPAAIKEESRPGILPNREELNLEGNELRRQSHGKRGKRRAYQITDQSLEAKENGKESALANMISRQPEKYTECTLDWNPGADFLYVNDKRFFWRFKRVRIEVMKYNGQRTEALGMGTM